MSFVRGCLKTALECSVFGGLRDVLGSFTESHRQRFFITQCVSADTRHEGQNEDRKLNRLERFLIVRMSY